jgi:hypothetical protein
MYPTVNSRRTENTIVSTLKKKKKYEIAAHKKMKETSKRKESNKNENNV